MQLVVAAPRAQQDSSLDGGSPQDLTFQETIDVLANGVTVISGLRDGGPQLGGEQEGVGAFDSGEAELLEGSGNGVRKILRLWERYGRVGA